MYLLPHLSLKNPMIELQIQILTLFLFIRAQQNRRLKKAVEGLFDVDVLSVNTMYKKGKKKRFGYVIGQQSTRKVAIVTLQDGQTIEAFGV